MYDYIIGNITMISPKAITLENNKIGYYIFVPNPYSFELNKEIKIFTEQVVREDDISLYGFKSRDEKDLFNLLMTISGIGPKSALSILASTTVNDFYRAVNESDAKYIAKFPGIGMKTSSMIILELKGKISFEETIQTSSVNTDAFEALLALGYTKKEVEKAFKNIDQTKPTNQIITDALKKL